MESADKVKTERWIVYYDSFEEMFQYFCDNTTIHGTIRLNCSKRNKMKTTFWLVIFLLSIAIMYWQFGIMINHYWAYPISTAISLQSKGNTFPAVTICNLNPYRFDEVNTYVNQLDKMAQETLYSVYKYDGPKARNQVIHLQDFLPNVTHQFNGSFQLDQSIVLLKLQENGSGPALPGVKKFQLGFKMCNSSGGDCYYKSYWSGVDALHEWYKYHYINIMSKIPPVLNTAGEELAKNFIFTCDFIDKPCIEREYDYFHHPIYGSCFTVNPQRKENVLYSPRPGKKYGLSLKVKVDQNDNMPLLSSAAGARIMIHNPNQPPLVEHDGFDIRPGTETSIGIKQDEVKHLGGKYGQCASDGNDLGFKLLYSTSYTLQACLNSCFQYKMIEMCGCGYYFYPLPPDTEYCNYNKYPGWGHCFYRLHEKMLDHRHHCFTQCPMQCTETRYQLSAGTAQWPSPTSKTWVIPVLNWHKGYNTTSKRSDVSKINIYYEEVSYQSVEETPAMPVTLLLSNMGGQWSWWFGSSVLSVVEIAELVLDTVAMVILITYRWKKKKRAPQ
ncbi:amiloride-sensitive sodium channel subunit alpha-like isoform X1 [Xenopus laevis]|uniref:Amiloride-sensitive sodium channel subunit alpha-like isoform X1 n=2 Tax=Xenopus laevis TaxID=8355 RepID=A0A1L8FM49_XENLA|nr:amiloride-sensitive sodium channel subunit alpha-like isoform X1 [Xenopus laevis]XP_041425300.1 amiloride-sensitive sodium channel subunit alpha-like isoform X1 [Xenopus laevis]OCT72674.1 hypothetical protein XELAEV_18035658mg [Xenopus laevis]